MLAAMALAATLGDCVPMRWSGAQPLEVLEGSGVSCLLVEEAQWGLAGEARRRGFRVLAVARTEEQGKRAAGLAVDAIVVEGGAPRPVTEKPVISLGARRALRFDGGDAVVGTVEAVWPGIEIEHGGPKTAAPTGSAWIHTNTGFLRFVRAVAKVPFWVGNVPAAGTAWTAARYAQAVADAAAAGARWVLAFDAKFPVEEWKRVFEVVRFYEAHGEWRRMKPWAEVAIVQDEANGGLVTGSLLDMLAVMNTPVRAVPGRELSAVSMAGTKVTVTVDERAYTAAQREAIARHGGKVVSGPAGWKMPEVGEGRITFDRAQYKELEAIWPELHQAVQRKNFGVRMFNVAGVLTYLLRDERGVVLEAVNYTDYAVENITAFVQGKYGSAEWVEPGSAPRKLRTYEAPDGTAVEIERVGVCGAVVLTPIK
ncbi:MAG: hypothetical protein JNK48_05605 [Bryobacterales bacterium]|nr:hypothetical protein [Bryobacterales bacterium]